MPGPVPGIHVVAVGEKEDVDGRDKPGQDGFFLRMVRAFELSKVKHGSRTPPTRAMISLAPLFAGRGSG
jgi:hypothetical protein